MKNNEKSLLAISKEQVDSVMGLYSSGKINKAINSSKKVTAIEPNNSQAHSDLKELSTD